jgi:hypothetical protein
MELLVMMDYTVLLQILVLQVFVEDLREIVLTGKNVHQILATKLQTNVNTRTCLMDQAVQVTQGSVVQVFVITMEQAVLAMM